MNANNPYAPPKAIVEDAVEPPMPRPRSVTIAVWMLWSELAMSVTVAILHMYNAPNTMVFLSALIGAVLFQGLSALLNYKIWQGRNWARITYLVLLGLSALSILSMAAVGPTGLVFAPSIETLFVGLGCLLDLVALYLVFVPGRAWFRRRSVVA